MTKTTLFPTLVAPSVLGALASVTAAPRREFVPVAHGPFQLKSYTGKCLTYGTWGQPKYPRDPASSSKAGLSMDDCNRSGVARPNEDLLQRILSDVALSDSSTWKVSYGARGNWTPLRSGEIELKEAVAMGSVDARPGADVLAWEEFLWTGDDPRHLRIFSGGWVDPSRHSRWHLR